MIKKRYFRCYRFIVLFITILLVIVFISSLTPSITYSQEERKYKCIIEDSFHLQPITLMCPVASFPDSSLSEPDKISISEDGRSVPKPFLRIFPAETTRGICVSFIINVEQGYLGETVKELMDIAEENLNLEGEPLRNLNSDVGEIWHSQDQLVKPTTNGGALINGIFSLQPIEQNKGQNSLNKILKQIARRKTVGTTSACEKREEVFVLFTSFPPPESDLLKGLPNLYVHAFVHEDKWEGQGGIECFDSSDSLKRIINDYREQYAISYMSNLYRDGKSHIIQIKPCKGVCCYASLELDEGDPLPSLIDRIHWETAICIFSVIIVTFVGLFLLQREPS